MQQARLHAPHIRFIDPDRVEPKNVGRQLFTAADADLNLYKAEVLARRFNQTLGLAIEGITEPLDAERHFERYSSNLIVGAVDNHLARRELAKVSGVWLDVGNHFDSGQIIIGNTTDRDRVLDNIDGDNGKYRYLPNGALLFPQLLEPEPSAEPKSASCADLVATGEQHVLVNDLMACVAGAYLYKLLHRQPIHTFLSYASVDTMTVRSVPICRAEILPYLEAV